MESAASIYYMPFTYIDVFVIGAFAAFYLRSNRQREGELPRLHGLLAHPWAAPFLVVSAAILIRRWGGGMATSVEGRWAVPYVFLPFVVGGLLYAVAVNPVFTKVLSFGPMRIIGTLSYAMYLVHLPVAFYLPRLISVEDRSNYVGSFAYTLFAFAIICAVASILHHAVEKPFLSLKSRFRPEQRCGPWASLTTCPLVAGGMALVFMRSG